jgi:hypothetical protein
MANFEEDIDFEKEDLVLQFPLNENLEFDRGGSLRRILIIHSDGTYDTYYGFINRNNNEETEKSLGLYDEEDEDEETLFIDENIRHADWLRTLHWDIEASTAEAFLDFLGVSHSTKEEQTEMINHFMSLPVAESMPESLKMNLRNMGLLGNR